jgi:hypothetical protein
MKIWAVSFSVLMDEKNPDDWSNMDTYTVAGDTIQEAIQKCIKKASEGWSNRKIRVDKAVFSLEVDVE